VPPIEPRVKLITMMAPAINSALQQTYRNCEVIVVDDGSSDGTADVVRRFMATNPDIRLLENPGNRGKGYSVRNGLLQAAGEIVMFTDADLSAPMEEAELLMAAIDGGASRSSFASART